MRPGSSSSSPCGERAREAKASGGGRPAISNIENGKTSGIDFAVLAGLADALRVNAAVLIEHVPGRGGVSSPRYAHRGARGCSPRREGIVISLTAATVAPRA